MTGIIILRCFNMLNVCHILTILQCPLDLAPSQSLDCYWSKLSRFEYGFSDTLAWLVLRSTNIGPDRPVEGIFSPWLSPSRGPVLMR